MAASPLSLNEFYGFMIDSLDAVERAHPSGSPTRNGSFDVFVETIRGIVALGQRFESVDKTLEGQYGVVCHFGFSAKGMRSQMMGLSGAFSQIDISSMLRCDAAKTLFAQSDFLMNAEQFSDARTQSKHPFFEAHESVASIRASIGSMIQTARAKLLRPRAQRASSPIAEVFRPRRTVSSPLVILPETPSATPSTPVVFSMRHKKALVSESFLWVGLKTLAWGLARPDHVVSGAVFWAKLFSSTLSSGSRRFHHSSLIGEQCLFLSMMATAIIPPVCKMAAECASP